MPTRLALVPSLMASLASGRSPAHLLVLSLPRPPLPPAPAGTLIPLTGLRLAMLRLATRAGVLRLLPLLPPPSGRYHLEHLRQFFSYIPCH